VPLKGQKHSAETRVRMAEGVRPRLGGDGAASAPETIPAPSDTDETPAAME